LGEQARRHERIVPSQQICYICNSRFGGEAEDHWRTAGHHEAVQRNKVEYERRGDPLLECVNGSWESAVAEQKYEQVE
jgi:hypothetical protein